MNLFVHCFDDDLKNELVAKGYKLLKDVNGLSILAPNQVKFDFSKVDKKKYIFSNKLTF